jgi:hypothetical protein
LYGVSVGSIGTCLQPARRSNKRMALRMKIS